MYLSHLKCLSKKKGYINHQYHHQSSFNLNKIPNMVGLDRRWLLSTFLDPEYVLWRSLANSSYPSCIQLTFSFGLLTGCWPQLAHFTYLSTPSYISIHLTKPSESAVHHLDLWVLHHTNLHFLALRPTLWPSYLCHNYQPPHITTTPIEKQTFPHEECFCSSVVPITFFIF